MIPSDDMNCYTPNKELNYDILTWINKRILDVLDVYIDVGNDTVWDMEYLLYCFPRTYIEDHGKEGCMSIIYDIKDILKSKYIYEDIRLIYKYFLVNLIAYYQTIYEDEKKWSDFNEEESLFPPLEIEIKKRIYKEYGYDYDKDSIVDGESELVALIDHLEDVDSLFWDDVFDYLEVDTDYISCAIEQFIRQFNEGKEVDIDFAYYEDLMNRNTKEKYYKIKPILDRMKQKIYDNIAEKRLSTHSKEWDSLTEKENLVESICDVCMMLQSNQKGIMPNENARNTYIKQLLTLKGYIVIDQTLCGESATGKTYGELDLEILNSERIPYAIIEALNLSNFSGAQANYLYNHLKKLLNNYNPMGLKLSFLLSYLKCERKDFDAQWEKYLDYIKQNVPDNYLIEIINKNCFSKGNFLKCTESNYKIGESIINIYHIFVLIDQ